MPQPEIVLVNTYLVPRDPAEVFALHLDVEREATWAPSIVGIERFGRPATDGTVFRYRFRLMGRVLKFDYRLHDIRAPHEFDLTGTSGVRWFFDNNVKYAVEDDGRGGARVTLTTRITRIPWLLRLVRPLMIAAIRRDYAEYERCAVRYLTHAEL